MRAKKEKILQAINLHLGIAEQGKIYALEGDHVAALAHYREAMRLAVNSGASEVFFRHYMESSLESLEQMEAYQEVRDYCERAIQHYEVTPPVTDVANLDLASIYQRLGVTLLKMDMPDESKEAFTRALAIADIPLAKTVLGWLKASLHITKDRVYQEQVKHGYFAVNKESVDHFRAIKMPQIENSELQKGQEVQPC